MSDFVRWVKIIQKKKIEERTVGQMVGRSGGGGGFGGCRKRDEKENRRRSMRGLSLTFKICSICKISLPPPPPPFTTPRFPFSFLSIPSGSIAESFLSGLTAILYICNILWFFVPAWLTEPFCLILCDRSFICYGFQRYCGEWMQKCILFLSRSLPVLLCCIKRVSNA